MAQPDPQVVNVDAVEEGTLAGESAGGRHVAEKSCHLGPRHETFDRESDHLSCSSNGMPPPALGARSVDWRQTIGGSVCEQNYLIAAFKHCGRINSSLLCHRHPFVCYPPPRKQVLCDRFLQPLSEGPLQTKSC